MSRGATALAHHTAELPGTGTDAAHLGPGWRDSVAQHLRELGEAWDDPAAWQGSANVPGLDLSNEMWGKITLTEVVVHGWDIAKATGQPFDLPEHTLQACLDPRRQVRAECSCPGPVGASGGRCARRGTP